MVDQPFVLIISGPTNAGKSFFANELLEEAAKRGISCARISSDEFYKDLSHLSMEERIKINYDDPSSIDKETFIQTIRHLSSSSEVRIPIYDFTTHTQTNQFRSIKPANLIIVEGIFSLSFDELIEISTLSIYVELDADLRLMRRVRRDLVERGRSLDSVLSQYEHTVRPTQINTVMLDMKKADLVIYGDREHTKIIDLILSKAKEKL
ncbi:MAG: uridine kinase [Candidatus Heimdallarchaeota archaeon]|nr:uridine kinase [Candidatus Heimdallarchaeota archaeon]